MLHYASGKPDNDDLQVVENQLARQRLFSVHPDHFKPLSRWVDDLRDGVLSFDDQLARTPSLSGRLARADARMRQEMSERGCDPQTWVPYEDALRSLSSRLGPGQQYSQHPVYAILCHDGAIFLGSWLLRASDLPSRTFRGKTLLLTPL